MNIRIVLASAFLLLLPAAGHAAETCLPPGQDVDQLARDTAAKLTVAPYWSNAPAWMVPWDQPVTLHVSASAKFTDNSPNFAVIGKAARGQWRSYAVQSWHPANDTSGDLVLIEPNIASKDEADKSAWGWSSLSLAVAVCDGKTAKAVGVVDAPLSPSCLSAFIALLITVAFYLLGALSLKRSVHNKLSRINPLWLALDGSGRASLSQMQIIFFSVIVLYLVSYIFLRTGILANLSNQVLLLLGIVGVGSAGGQLATKNVQRVSFDNWAWIKAKNWVTDGGYNVERPTWSDLFSTNDIFDPYRFQMVSFSFVIGIALLIIGVHGLANFSVPDALLGVIGLSQATYIGGKITAPTGFGDLDTKLTAVRAAQDAFLKATSARWVQPAKTDVEKEVRLQNARVDGRDQYLAFRALVCPAYEMFRTLFAPEVRPANPNLEPDPICC
jgi:hypothetical protein